jgi:hypothetical protein
VTPPAGLPDPVVVPPGKKFTISGVERELFSIGQVADVLNRSPVTLRKWEARGIIPRATFVKSGANKDVRGRRRLYSREQVEALVRIAQEEKILHDPHKQITSTQFTVKVRAAFKELAGAKK